MPFIRMFLLMFIATLLCAGCDKAPDPDQKYINTGRAASQKLMQSLKGALVSAITDSGIAGAINICSNKALELTAEIDAQSDSIADIRRVSDKFRNPHNAPDAIDSEAMAFFKDYQAKNNSLPGYHLVRAGQNIRYYHPLAIQPLCLNCHGQTGQMDPSALARINAIYPEDMAVGYKLGELRGLIKVTMIQ